MFDRIMCPVDFSDFSRHALTCALRMARLYRSHVTVLHVEPVGAAVAAVPAGFGYDADALIPIEADITLRHLAEFAAVSPDERTCVDYRVAAGSVWRGIVEEAALTRANLIVIGTHGRSGSDRLLFGSVADKVLRKAPCPVLTVPPPDASFVVQPQGEFTRILCAVDFSDASMAALRAAEDVAAHSGATLLVLHVIELPEGSDDGSPTDDIEPDEALDAYRRHCTQQLRDAIPAHLRDCCTAATTFVKGKAHGEIVRAAGAEFADLVVLGARGRGASSRWTFGSTAEQVVHHAACPVLTVAA